MTNFTSYYYFEKGDIMETQCFWHLYYFNKTHTRAPSIRKGWTFWKRQRPYMENIFITENNILILFYHRLKYIIPPDSPFSFSSNCGCILNNFHLLHCNLFVFPIMWFRFPRISGSSWFWWSPWNKRTHRTYWTTRYHVIYPQDTTITQMSTNLVKYIFTYILLDKTNYRNFF